MIQSEYPSGLSSNVHVLYLVPTSFVDIKQDETHLLAEYVVQEGQRLLQELKQWRTDHASWRRDKYTS